jgi:hypothetical protein
MQNKLIAAAQAVVEQWDCPNWKTKEPTAKFIENLRRALLEAALSAAQPVAWVDEQELRYLETVSSNNAWAGFERSIKVGGEKEGRSALYAAPPEPSLSVKALADAYQKYLDAVNHYNERHAIMKTKAPGSMRVDEEYKAIDETRRAFDKLAVEVATSGLSAQVQGVAGYQSRVEAAHHALFHDDPTDVSERNARSFEEAIETAQAFGMTEGEAFALVKYTFSRPIGEPEKELGAKVLTAFSLGIVAGIDVMGVAEAELEKLQRPETIARIRAKRATRHGRGPLPGLDPALPTKQEG